MPLGQMCCVLHVWDKSYNDFTWAVQAGLCPGECWGVCAVSGSSGCEAVALAVNSFEATNQGQFMHSITVTATQETSCGV